MSGISIPYTFSPNTVILSAQVNANFSTLGSNALNRTGDAMTGALTTLSLIPTSDDASDIGTTSVRYKRVYVSGTTLSAVVSASTVTVSGTTTSGVFVGSGVGITNITRAGLTKLLNISTTNTSVTITSTSDVVLVDASSTSVTITLMGSPSNGQQNQIKKIDSSANVVTVAGNGHNIDGASTHTIFAQYETYTYIYGVAEWGIY